MFLASFNDALVDVLNLFLRFLYCLLFLLNYTLHPQHMLLHIIDAHLAQLNYIPQRFL